MSRRMVAVISAYNARPEFLETQVLSILAQTVPVEVFVRDDGSTSEDTRRMLHACERMPGVSVSFGENLGFEAGFLQALREAPAADYYAFSDQDDMWLPRHAEHALELLEDARATRDADVPVLCCSRFAECDDELNATYRQPPQPYMGTFENALVEAIPGMVMTFNAALRDLILQADPSQIPGHDWLAYVVASGSGVVLCDPDESVLKRRHEANVSTGKLTGMRLLAFRLRRFFFGDGLARVRTMYGECQRLYGELLGESDRDLLQQFALPNTPAKALRKATWPQRYRISLTDEVAVRALFLLGRL